MFNNRFNSSKNDPLVEAVKQAQAEGDLRRQAIAAVNEQFGVFSRNAVVREDLAAYDAAIEEAYKCMKEGNKDNKEKKKEHEEKVGMEHIKKMGGFPGQSLKRTARSLTKEEKKLADKDYDKDGKIESPKDEVWGSRFRAAKAAGKMEEGSAVSGEDPGMEVAKQAGARQQSQTPSSTPARTGNAAGSTISNARSAAGMNEEEQIDEISKELAGKYIKHADYKRSESSFRSGKVYGKELATKRRTKQDVEDARKHNRDSFKREKGINMAVNKLTGRAKVQANEEVMKESIKAKLLAKHMKEDQSFNAAHLRGKSVNEAEDTGVVARRNIRQGSKNVLANILQGRFGAAASSAKQFATGMGQATSHAADVIKNYGGAAGRALEEPTAKASTVPSSTAPSTTSATTTPVSSGGGTGRTSSGGSSGTVTPTAPKAEPQTAPTATKPAAAPSAGTPKPAAPASKPMATATKSGYFKSSPNVSKGDYTIKRGDTLSAIAKAKGTTVGAIQSMNKGLTNVNKIAAGGQLNLPTAMKSPSAGAASSASAGPKPTASVPTPPRRPSFSSDTPAAKAEPVSPSTPATPTGGSDAMKPDYHRTTVPGNRTGDVTPTAKPMTATPDVGRSTSTDTNAPSISVAPEKSSTTPPEEKKKAPAPAPATTAVEHRLSESVVSVGVNKYRIV